jgi:hypothetical protein
MDLLKDSIFGKAKRAKLIKVVNKNSYMKYNKSQNKNIVMIHYDPSYSALKPLLEVYTKIAEKF